MLIFEELARSEEGEPGHHNSIRQIEINLHCYERLKHLRRIASKNTSHRANQVQNFLMQKLKSKFVKSTDWPPKLPHCNLLDYHFCDHVQEKVYNGRNCYPFATTEELKRRICDVWDECATDLLQIRKE